MLELTDPAWKGKVGIAPSNASFQSFVTAMRVSAGEEAATAWLEGMVANDVEIYEGNGAIRDAVDAGQISLGLANHYYWYEKAAEVGADTLKVQNHFLAPGDAGSLVNVAGAAILATGADNPSAQAFVDYLLSTEGQEYFSDHHVRVPARRGRRHHRGPARPRHPARARHRPRRPRRPRRHPGDARAGRPAVAR